MSLTPIVLPITGGAGRIPGAVTWESTCVPTLESDPDADGTGCTAAIFGYLSDIWCRTVHPVSRVQDDVQDMSGSGEYVAPGRNGNPYLAAVQFDLDPPAPSNTDLIFGDVPIYYLGLCGFGVAPVLTGYFNAGPVVLQGQVSIGGSRKLPPIFINHLNNWIPAPHPQLNVFWWHLKPGVKGKFLPIAIDYGFGATTNVPGVAQGWLPSYGGWCALPPSPFGQVFDGCGLPACGSQ